MRRLALAVSIALGVPLGAHAATLYTPFLFVGPGEALNCGLVNASTKTLEVTTEVLSIEGLVLQNASATFAPGSGGGWSVDASQFPTHCRFTLKGKAASIRARACVHAGSGSCSSTAPAY